MQKTMRFLALPPILILLLFSSTVFGSISGKISGVVVNLDTGEPVEGATVRVQGTSLVTMTDMDGEYFIMNVPGGKYSVLVTYVGYEAISKENVRVLVDLTTPLDFDVKPGTVTLGTNIVVSAQAPIIQRDLTESKVIFTSDKLKELPNIVTVHSVLSNLPGVVVDANQNLHVRGGRSGQIAYLYDGYQIQDPFVASAGLRVMPAALEELSLVTGGFAAEYGEAMSGVVNAITREGRSTYHGSIRAYEGMTHSYDVIKGDWGGLNFNDNRSAMFDLSGPIPGVDPTRYTFFTAGEYLKDPSYLPMNGSIAYTGTAKFAIQPIPTLKVTTNLTYSKVDGRLYEHRDVNGVSYDLNLDGLPALDRDAYLVGLTGNYSLNESTIFTATINRFYSRTHTAPAHLMDKYWDQWPGYSEDSEGLYDGTIHENNYLGDIDFLDPRQSTGFTVGDDYDPRYMYRESAHNAFKLTLTKQATRSHQLSTGLELRRWNVFWDSKQFYNDNPYGEKYDSKPTNASAYIQDKMEYDNFVINLGVRADYSSSDIEYNVSPREQQTDINGNLPDVYKKADSKTRVAPRVGVSFPISEKSKMHFNYGVYYQEPRYTYMYTNIQGDLSTGYPLLGNPDLEPERTTSYELGMDHLIGDNLRFDITAYYKDIEDLVTTRSYWTYGQSSPITMFDNDDYGSAKGFDIGIDKLPMHTNWSASISYSFMIAEGNGSFASEPYYTYITSIDDNLAPITSYPLDFDQRHTLTAMFNYAAPKDWQGNLGGIPIPGAWGMSLVGRYGSGLPFTKLDSDGNRLGERNESRLPSHYTVDMRLDKDFYFGSADYNFSFFVEVDNLFDRRNVRSVYGRTGSPTDDGYDPMAGLNASQSDLDHYDRLFDKDPLNYSTPRTMRTGIEFSF